MNLNELWAGNDYAYFPLKGRGEVYREKAIRVKVIHVFKKTLSYNSKATGYAHVMFLDDEGKLQDDKPNRDVAVREIVMRWEEYADEREHRREKRAEQEKAKKELEAKEKVFNEFLLTKLESKGISRSCVRRITDYDVVLNKVKLEQELA